ncbi:hypothetical protein M8037_16395 [Sinorhizobium meliloti]|uniref:hypothetical protein n=1 Tax=Rhizobium meliloti TaxID=382 RepID=UPI002073EF53|nr:hypothetical protein [Sinorhizobium meliloti]MCM5690351.1 hypothetical protein [Sinorhizobium meliloti]
MVENPVSRWSDLFEQACRIIEQANSELTMIDGWTFGGGTALMLQIHHHESFDVDIFLDDPYATSTPHRFFSCSDLRLIYGPSNELTEEYLTSSL